MAEPEANAPTVALFGTFDVENYGDLLFPLIAKARLRSAGLDVLPVSPTDGLTGWRDAAPAVAIDHLAEMPAPLVAIGVGGGNIIHLRDTGLEDYRSRGKSRYAYPSLWLGAGAMAAVRDLPVFWNCPGVLPLDSKPRAARAIRSALHATDYLAVRDTASRAILERYVSAPVQVVPDTALDIGRIWPSGQLEESFRRLCKRHQSDSPRRFLAVHVKDRSLGKTSPQTFAASLAALCRECDLSPILLALGRCHGDDAVARSISATLPMPHICLDGAERLEDIASVIASAYMSIGASLHGYITATAYRTPARLVAVPQLAKFGGFAEHIGRKPEIVADWPAAFDGVRAHCAAPRVSGPVPESVTAALDAHWDEIIRVATTPSALRPRRMRYLRLLGAEFVAQHGVTAILEPSLSCKMISPQ